MLSVIDDIGSSIRQAYHWVGMERECILVMDNAGGHGRKRAIDKYTEKLKSKYNI